MCVLIEMKGYFSFKINFLLSFPFLFPFRFRFLFPFLFLFPSSHSCSLLYYNVSGLGEDNEGEGGEGGVWVEGERVFQSDLQIINNWEYNPKRYFFFEKKCL